MTLALGTRPKPEERQCRNIQQKKEDCNTAVAATSMLLWLDHCHMGT